MKFLDKIVSVGVARDVVKSILALVILSMFSVAVIAQTNIATSATATHSSGGSGTYGPQLYNNNSIPGCTATGANQWGWVRTGGWILFTWSSTQTVTGLRFFKANRPMRTCTIQYWNGSSYVNIMNYNNSTTCDHSVSFGAVSTTRIRLLNVGGSSNPNHREIYVYGATCTNGKVGGTYTPTCSYQTISVGSGERRDFNVVSGRPYRFQLQSCPNWTWQLTGRNTSNTQLFQSTGTCTRTVDWTATYTGVLRLNINRSNCQLYQGNNSATLRYRQNPPASGSTTTWIGGTSGTNNWHVDNNWSRCKPNINIHANIPNTGQQPGITSSGAAKTLTIATGRVLTVGCSNCLEIGNP